MIFKLHWKYARRTGAALPRFSNWLKFNEIIYESHTLGWVDDKLPYYIYFPIVSVLCTNRHRPQPAPMKTAPAQNRNRFTPPNQRRFRTPSCPASAADASSHSDRRPSVRPCRRRAARTARNCRPDRPATRRAACGAARPAPDRWDSRTWHLQDGVVGGETH